MQDFASDLAAWAPQLLLGTEITVMLTVASMILALAIGLLVALIRLAPRRTAGSVIGGLYVELIRGTPLVLQLFYVFYVLPFFGIRLSKIAAGVLGLGLNYGAYLSEVFRAGILAIDRGQWEAAGALGLHRFAVLRHVVLPQAIRIVVPPIGNYFISLFKDTALVATISISELFFTGQLIAAETFKYLQIYSIVFVIYLAISYPASLGVRALERHLDRGMSRREVRTR